MKPLGRAGGLALMIAAPVLWSSAGVVTRHIQSAQPVEQVFWRSLFAFAFVLGFLLLQKTNPWKAVRAAGMPGLVSGLMWAIMFTAFLFALSLTTTANALVVMSVSPLLTALIASMFLKDPVPLRTWLAAGAAAIGIAWMFGSSLERHYLGMAIAFVIPVAAAINVVVLRASAAKLDLIPAVMLGGALSCLIALPFALPFTATPRDLALLAFLGVFQLGVPCMLLVLASRALLAPEIALLGLLEVVLGPLWAWLGAGEVPAGSTLLGGMIVLAALALNELPTLAVRPANCKP
ncbi:MAG TPA: DMT family transporter [Xanthomonadaceae bacterium]|nr:DMT family transporter [Xanthomonadaceae bacterium]